MISCLNQDGTPISPLPSWYPSVSEINASDDTDRVFLWRSEGFLYECVLICVDIDGINNGEDPFGYCIRTDGKIYTGARVDAWLDKELTDSN